MIRLDLLGTLALRGADGHELRAVLAQPKRLALLGYLAAESARSFQRRDHLFALFWPELDQAQARQALRQSLYFLRRALGDDIITNRGTEEIELSPARLRCDVCVFAELLEQQQLADALALYRGDFLTGFFIAEASAELEQWIEGTRARLRRQAVDAAWTLADADEADGRARDAVHWARFATGLAADDERSLQRLVALLDRQGDRAGALRAYAEFAARMQSELEVEPSAETRALIAAVRARMSPRATPPAPATPPGVDPIRDAPVHLERSDASAPSPASAGTVSRARRVRRGGYVAAAAVGAALTMVVAKRLHRAEVPLPLASPVVAVGWIQDPSGADTAANVRAFAELLANDLSRVRGLRVVTRARLYDVLGQLGTRGDTPSAISEAARRAGADELVGAVLSKSSGHGLRLEVRRVNLATATADPTESVGASTIFDLADRATAQLATDFGLRAPAEALTGVTTTSVAAQRHYDQGLRQFYQSDVQTAGQFFHAALAEDSTFAMAAYYAGLAEEPIDGLAARRDLALALRLAERVSDRERLIIRQTWAFATNDPAQLVLAESLATRYPDEPGGELALGRAITWNGDFLGALPHLRRAVHMDSLSLTGRGPWCRACDALGLMIGSYVAADSLRAAERTARDWTRMQPRAAEAWWKLASVFGREERYRAARAAEQMAERVGGAAQDDALPRIELALRSGAFTAADRMLLDRVQSGNSVKRGEALWWLVISLRDQGRLREALAEARRLVQTTAAAPPGFSTPRSLDAVSVAQVLFEMGRYRESAALFDSVANYAWSPSADFARDAPGLVARNRIWMTTHAATAFAAAGDTARLAPLADSIAMWGRQSAYFRDRRLHFYVTGLLLAARGRRRDAERAFRRALIEPVDGYSRVNLQLALVLLAEGRPRAAIPILQAPLHGSIEASNYYLTDTDLHATLGEAFDRAGEPDSALVHYQRALAAWRHADPQIRPRIEAIRRRVAALRALAAASPGRG